MYNFECVRVQKTYEILSNQCICKVYSGLVGVTLISLINVKSSLPILKNSTLHKKIAPLQYCCFLNYTKTV